MTEDEKNIKAIAEAGEIETIKVPKSVKKYFSKLGKTTAKRMTPEQRKERAMKAYLATKRAKKLLTD